MDDIKTTDIVLRANMSIANAAEFKAAGGLLRDIKSMMKQVRASVDPTIDKAHKAHKEGIAQRETHLGPLQDAEKALKATVGVYAAKLERERVAEQRRLEQEAHDARQAEMDRAMATNDIASQLATEGDMEGAAEVQAEAREIAKQSAEIMAPKARTETAVGISTRKDWIVEITDDWDIIPREYMMPNEPAIRAFVKATKGKRGIAGVKITPKDVVAVRS